MFCRIWMKHSSLHPAIFLRTLDALSVIDLFECLQSCFSQCCHILRSKVLPTCSSKAVYCRTFSETACSQSVFDTFSKLTDKLMHFPASAVPLSAFLSKVILCKDRKSNSPADQRCRKADKEAGSKFCHYPG
jgi:hypothetical protein